MVGLKEKCLPWVEGVGGGVLAVRIFFRTTHKTSLKILQSLTLHKIFGVKKSLKGHKIGSETCTNNVFIISVLRIGHAQSGPGC